MQPLKTKAMGMSINRRINVNATFDKGGIFAFCKDAECELKSSGLSAKQWVEGIYSKHEALYGHSFVMASKKMRRSGHLIGVGRYLVNEK